MDLLGSKNSKISNFAINSAQLYDQLPKIEADLLETNGCMELINNIFMSHTEQNVIQDDHIPFLRYGKFFNLIIFRFCVKVDFLVEL